MDIARIREILADSLGEVDEEQEPIEGSESCNLFVATVVMKTAKVHEHAPEIIELLKEWPSESWGNPIPPLGAEIDWITAGGALEDQQLAFMLFGFGKIAGWWKIMDPHSLFGFEYDDPRGRELAGTGMVLIGGYSPEATIQAN